jgi:hypothetical protein
MNFSLRATRTDLWTCLAPLSFLLEYPIFRQYAALSSELLCAPIRGIFPAHNAQVNLGKALAQLPDRLADAIDRPRTVAY